MEKKLIITNILILIICIILFFTNDFIIKKYTDILFFKGYFNDLLAPIVMFTTINIVASIFTNKTIYKFRTMFIMIFISSFFWEYGLFFINKNTTPDIIDILYYHVGMVIYYFIYSVFIKQ